MVFGLSKKESLRVLGAIISFLLIAACSSENAGTVDATDTLDNNPDAAGSMANGAVTAGSETADKTFVIEAQHLRYFRDGVENPELRVKLGDTVKIEFNNLEGFHDWKLDEFNAATEKVRAPASSSVEFVADNKGEFEYYCSVGSHREQGMKGKLIVE